MAAPRYTGRFAPSPTGELHFGSLVAAVGSFLQARHNEGQWLVRVEDLDPPRVVAGSARGILEELARFGMQPDQAVRHQSERDAAYAAALEHLAQSGKLFSCTCTRSMLPDGPYPGTCRARTQLDLPGTSVRVRVNDNPITFVDRVQGSITENLAQTCGDFVVQRADGVYAYQLAVVVDDDWQGVTEIVRGADLLDSTPRQIHLQNLLGLPQPTYCHLPVVNDHTGRKLGKRFAADPISRKPALDALGDALSFLGHRPPKHSTLSQRWDWAHSHWNPEQIPPEQVMDSGPGGEPLYSGNSH